MVVVNRNRLKGRIEFLTSSIFRVFCYYTFALCSVILPMVFISIVVMGTLFNDGEIGVFGVIIILIWAIFVLAMSFIVYDVVDWVYDCIGIKDLLLIKEVKYVSLGVTNNPKIDGLISRIYDELSDDQLIDWVDQVKEVVKRYNEVFEGKAISYNKEIKATNYTVQYLQNVLKVCSGSSIDPLEYLEIVNNALNVSINQ